jgi:hypothetical protein
MSEIASIHMQSMMTYRLDFRCRFFLQYDREVVRNTNISKAINNSPFLLFKKLFTNNGFHGHVSTTTDFVAVLGLILPKSFPHDIFFQT